MPKALPHAKIEKKRTKKIARFHSDKYMRVKPSWRRPRGIDNPLRRHYRGRGAMPGIGYGSNKKTRFLDQAGFKQVVVNNVKELNTLMMHNRKYAAVIAHSVGARKRKELVQRARELDVRVVNAEARLKTEEQK